MVEVRTYYLKPTPLIPNSPLPLLHYRNVLSSDAQRTADKVQTRFSDNGWETRWIVRYGETQRSHYHSIHETMAVLCGSATIRFGVADTVEDMDENTKGSGWEAGGIELEAQAGDVFVIPAGVAHKTFHPVPLHDFLRLTGGDGNSPLESGLENVELSGFVMIGAYPKGSRNWDFAEGGEHEGKYEEVWSVQPPMNDPIFGNSKEGISGKWRKESSPPSSKL